MKYLRICLATLLILIPFYSFCWDESLDWKDQALIYLALQMLFIFVFAGYSKTVNRATERFRVIRIVCLTYFILSLIGAFLWMAFGGPFPGQFF